MHTPHTGTRRRPRRTPPRSAAANLSEMSFMSVEEGRHHDGDDDDDEMEMLHDQNNRNKANVDISMMLCTTPPKSTTKRMSAMIGTATQKRMKIIEHAQSVLKRTTTGLLSSRLGTKTPHQHQFPPENDEHHSGIVLDVESSSPPPEVSREDAATRELDLVEMELTRLASLLNGNALSNAVVQELVQQISHLQTKLDHHHLLRVGGRPSEEIQKRCRRYAETAGELGERLQRYLSAEEAKGTGNALYSQGRYAEAELAYRRAQSLDPNNSVFYANRAASLLMLERYVEAIEECNRAIALNPNFLRAYLRCARAMLAVGDAYGCLSKLSHVSREAVSRLPISAEEANKTVKEAFEMGAQARSYVNELAAGDAALGREECDAAEAHAERALAIAPASSSARTLRITATLMRSVIDIVTKGAMRVPPAPPEEESRALASAVREALLALRAQECRAEDVHRYGHVLLRRALRTEAGAYFEAARASRPDEEKFLNSLRLVKKIDEGLKAAGKHAMEGRPIDALRAYDSVLTLDPTNFALNGRVHYQRSAVNMQANRLREADEDLRRCLKCLPQYDKARIRRVRLLLTLGSLAEAREELSRVEINFSKLTPPQAKEARELREQLNRMGGGFPSSFPSSSSSQGPSFKRSTSAPPFNSSNPNDLYAVLGVSCKATTEEIKRAYKQAALKYHPDKTGGDVAATEKFKKMVEAFSVLSSPTKRRNYDAFANPGNFWTSYNG